MNISMQQSLADIMTADPISVEALTPMDKVGMLFDLHRIHHIPVLDNDKKVIGVISHHDFCQLQDHFTRIMESRTESKNQRFMQSLLANEVMTKDPFCLKNSDTLASAVHAFMKNEFHSIMIIDEGEQCVGIVTPYDIIKMLHNHDRG